MRVVAGTVGGHRLKAPKGKETRPTEDRIKESVFNILGQSFQGGRVLDLFAGSGGNGIEFLSRGCDFCYFVDNSREAEKIILENLEHTHLLEKSKVIRSNFKKAFQQLEGEELDYIYLDPPFLKEDYYYDSFERILEYHLLKKNGLLIIEHNWKFSFQPMDGFAEIKLKNYGNITISIWRRS